MGGKAPHHGQLAKGRMRSKTAYRTSQHSRYPSCRRQLPENKLVLALLVLPITCDMTLEARSKSCRRVDVSASAEQ